MRDDKENKKNSVEYQIDIPVVIFSYRTEKEGKECVFEQRYEYNSMFEKFGIKKEESDENNPEKIVQALEKCFSTNKVTIEIFKKTEFALDFREEDDRTIFKAFLEPTIKTNQATLKSNPDQKVNIQWEISIPNVIFSYTDENGITFEEKLDYNCMFEKFGQKPNDVDKKNGMHLQGLIIRHFYQNKVSLEVNLEHGQKKNYAIEFKGEDNSTLFKVFLKKKMNANLICMKNQPDKKFCIEWVIDIPNVIFNYKEKKDGKEIIHKGQLDYGCTFEKFGVKKEEKDENNPTGLTSVIKKYFDEGKVNVQEYKEGHNTFYKIEFLEEGDKTLFQVFLRY